METAFLNGELDETIFMVQSVRYNDNSVCKLLGSLYGLKQAARQWFRRYSNYSKVNLKCRKQKLLRNFLEYA